MRIRRKIMAALALIALVAISGRIAAPHLIRAELNARLSQLQEYSGHIDNVDLQLMRNRVILHRNTVRKRDAAPDQPVFFQAPRIEVRLSSFLPGERGYLARLDVFNAALNFVKQDDDTNRATNQLGLTEDWVALVDDLVPLPVERIVLHQSAASIHVPTDRPDQPFELTIEGLGGDIVVRGSGRRVVMDLRGTVLGESAMVLHLEADPDRPDADSSGYWQMDPLSLAQLNPVLRRWSGLDVESGTYSGALVLNVKDQQVEGHLKSVMTRVDLLDFSDGGPINWLLEGIMGAAINLAGTGDDQRLAASIPLAGTVDAAQLQSASAIRDFVIDLLPSITDWGETHRLDGPGATAHLPVEIESPADAR